jgi:hypothetical protein
MEVAVTKDEQREIFRKHARDGLDRLIDRLVSRGEVLMAMAEERAFDTPGVGFDDYDDSSFRKTVGQLEAEADAELADGIFYCALEEWQLDKLRKALL